ncbi:MAG: hypothetical protein ACAH95_15580 [Fimbriimonas sp.]
METAGKIYRIKTNSISIGQQNWPKGSLISAERLGPLVKYFKDLAMIEEVSFVKVDQINEGHRKAA